MRVVAFIFLLSVAAMRAGAAQTSPVLLQDGQQIFRAACAACHGPDGKGQPRNQPIAFRWAKNLTPYDADEPRRFVSYFDAMSSQSSVVIGTAALQVQ